MWTSSRCSSSNVHLVPKAEKKKGLPLERARKAALMNIAEMLRTSWTRKHLGDTNHTWKELKLNTERGEYGL